MAGTAEERLVQLLEELIASITETNRLLEIVAKEAAKPK